MMSTNLFLEYTIFCTVRSGVQLRCIRTPTTNEYSEVLVEATEAALETVSNTVDAEATVDDAWDRLRAACAETASTAAVLPRPIVFTKDEATRLLYLPINEALIWQESGELQDLRATLCDNRLAAMDAYHAHKSKLLEDGWKPSFMPEWEDIAPVFRSVPGWKEGEPEADEDGDRHFFVHSETGKEVGPELRDGYQYNLQWADKRIGPWFQAGKDQRVWVCDDSGTLFCTSALAISSHQKFTDKGYKESIYVSAEGRWNWAKFENWGHRSCLWLRQTNEGATSYLRIDETYVVEEGRDAELRLLTQDSERPELRLAHLTDPKTKTFADVGALYAFVRQAVERGLQLDIPDERGNQLLDSLAKQMFAQVDTQSKSIITSKRVTIYRCIRMVIEAGADLNRCSGPWGLPVGVTVAAALQESVRKGIILVSAKKNIIAYGESLLEKCDLSKAGVLQKLKSTMPMECLEAGASPLEALHAGFELRNKELVKEAIRRGANPNAYLQLPDMTGGTPVWPVFETLSEDVLLPEWRELLDPAGLDLLTRGSGQHLTRSAADLLATGDYVGTKISTAFCTHLWNTARGFRSPANAAPSKWDADTRAQMEALSKQINFEEAPGALYAVGSYVGLVPRQTLERGEARERDTKLQYAREAAGFLVSMGADPTRRDAFRALCWIGADELVRKALDAGADPSAGVFEAAAQGHDDILALLLARGGGVEERSGSLQAHARSPLAGCSTLRGYQLLRDAGATLSESARAHLLSIGHASRASDKPLSAEHVRIAAAVVTETGWRKGQQVHGRFFGAEGMIDSPAPVLEAAAKISAGPNAKAKPAEAKVVSEEALQAIICDQKPFLGFRFCDAEQSPTNVSAGDYTTVHSTDASMRLHEGQIRSVALTQDEASRLHHVVGSRYEAITTSMFEPLGDFEWSPEQVSLGQPVGNLVVGGFSLGDGEVFLRTLDYYPGEDWAKLQEAIQDHLSKDTLTIEPSEFQGHDLVVRSMEHFNQMVKVHPVDEQTLAVLGKVFPNGSESFDTMRNIADAVQA